MKALRRSSDVLFVLAVVLLVWAVVATIKLLALLAFVVFVGSIVLSIAKRRVARRHRQT